MERIIFLNAQVLHGQTDQQTKTGAYKVWVWCRFFSELEKLQKLKMLQVT